jgi:hypothetical protein
MNALARAASCSASTSGAPAGSRVKSTSAWRVSPPTRSGRGGPARGVTLRAAARKGKRAPDSNGEDDDDSARAEGLARENAGAPRPRPSSGARKEEKHHHLNKSKSKGSSPVPYGGESGKKSAPGPPKQAMNIPNADGAGKNASPRGKSLEDLALDPNSSIDPDLDIIPAGPPVEDEVFKLRKKRLELVIEEKEWSLEDAREGEDKMAKIVDYVNAVEAYKELCSTQVPNTVSDLLSQYVQVYVITPGAPGYDQAFEFLCMGDDEDDDEESSFGDGAAESEGARRGFARPQPKRDSIDISQVDDIIRALVGDDDDSDSEDEDEDEDEEDLEQEAWRLLRSAARDGPGPLHAAQDVEGKWRWLEDDLGRALERKPEGDFVVKLMSVEEMVTNGLNVNSLHEEVDPAELVDFAGCKSWEDAIRVGREVEAALEHMRADGWEVDTRSWCNDADALMVVKELTPLRTMSYVDGRVSSREKKKDGNAQSFDGAKEKEQTLSAEGRGGGVMRGDNNVVNNNLSSDSERTPDDETRDLAA